MVDGLDNFRRSKALAQRGMRLPNQFYFKPSDFYSFYNELPLLNAGINGASLAQPGGGNKPKFECGMAFAEDSDFLDTAPRLFNTTYSVPNWPINSIGLSRVVVGSNPGRNGDETEALLDIEWGHTVAPGAIIFVYISGDLYDSISRAISTGRCGVVSISFSFCGASPSFYQTLDLLFARAAAYGQSVFVSSGDVGAAGEVPSGSHCGPGKSRGVNEMAASPNVTAVGGTQFTPTYDASGNVGGIVPESAWDDSSPPGPPGATGGGQSGIFDKPDYQKGVTPNDQKRDVPDIAFGASWNSAPGFWIAKDTNGQPALDVPWGGTSIAAPMWAGVARLISQKARRPGKPRAPNPRLGNMNLEIYKLGAAARGLRDVTTGNNNFNGVTGFSAGVGYDQTTGWGTADITSFVNAYTADICPQCP